MILATAPDGKAMGTLIDGLGVDGKLLLIGASTERFAVLNQACRDRALMLPLGQKHCWMMLVICACRTGLMLSET